MIINSKTAINISVIFIINIIIIIFWDSQQSHDIP